MPIEIQLLVNGASHTLVCPPERRLLDVLRDDLGLTGAKEGCGIGECGACTVLMNGLPVNACLVPAWQAHGAEIVTVEGLGTPESPHPFQSAMVEKGGVQCGFCTPGMVVAGVAVLRDHPLATRDDLRQLMSGNTCRCTGYKQILDAMEQVALGTRPCSPAPDRVGERSLRVEAMEKVTGVTRYTADLPLPEACLHGVTVRARHVHARLEGVDVEGALRVPGVKRVLVAADVPGQLCYGNAIPDQPVFAKDRVRFWGEAVALVLAETLQAAQEGASKVKILAHDLPPVLSAEQALEDGAPSLHPDYPGTVKRGEGNLLCEQRLAKGDPIEQALQEAEITIEREYTTQAQEHLCLEPEAALAIPEPGGVIRVIAPSQNVFFDRHHICNTLGLPKDRVHVVQAPTGAAFGGREDLYAQIHAALGALLTGRPVRVVWTREETQIATTKRHPARMRYRVGATREGKLLALHADILADGGAYASWSPNIARKMLVHAAGAYEIPSVSVRVCMAYTNNGFSGAFRGFGATQVTFAVESLIDELALALDMSPLDLRLRNHLEEGRITATGQLIKGSCGLRACVDQALEKARQLEARRSPPALGFARGRGLAMIFYGIGYGNAIPDIGSAIVELGPDGRFCVRCGAVDYGQGAITVFTQIACEVLGVSRACLDVRTGDSAETPDSGSTVASRQTYVSGEAVRQAATRLRDALLETASSRLGCLPAEIRLCDGGVRKATDQGDPALLGLGELAVLCVEAGVKTSRQARFKASTTRLDLETGQGDAYWPYAFACHVADIEVERATGQIKLLSLVAAHDVGRVINPTMAEGQVIGGATQGIGFALHEDHRLERGVPLTRNLDTYKVPGFADVPDIIPIFIEAPEPSGPFGAKGVGEPVLVAVAPAIANAVFDATGARIRDLPLLPEKILAELSPAPEAA